MVSMTLDEYQEISESNAGTTDYLRGNIIFGLGVAGEAGEVADIVKKWYGHGHDIDRTKLCKELGDVLWYVAMLAKIHDFKLSDIASANILKLRERYPNGFSKEDSRNRKS